MSYLGNLFTIESDTANDLVHTLIDNHCITITQLNMRLDTLLLYLQISICILHSCLFLDIPVSNIPCWFSCTFTLTHNLFLYSWLVTIQVGYMLSCHWFSTVSWDGLGRRVVYTNKVSIFVWGLYVIIIRHKDNGLREEVEQFSKNGCCQQLCSAA